MLALTSRGSALHKAGNVHFSLYISVKEVNVLKEISCKTSQPPHGCAAGATSMEYTNSSQALFIVNHLITLHSAYSSLSAVD